MARSKIFTPDNLADEGLK